MFCHPLVRVLFAVVFVGGCACVFALLGSAALTGASVENILRDIFHLSHNPGKL